VRRERCLSLFRFVGVASICVTAPAAMGESYSDVIVGATV
jgi:hypothetical protein